MNEEFPKKLKYALYGLELVSLGISIYMVLRVVVGADTITRARMGLARATARTAKRQADVWSGIASKADTAYWQARNTIL